MFNRFLGYQFKIGASYLLSEETDLFLEGVYKRTGNELWIDGTQVDPLNMYSAHFGARYKF